MVAFYTRVRTALMLTAAGTALLIALGAGLGVPSTQSVMPTSRPPPVRREILRAKLTSTQVLAGEQDLAVMIQMPAFRAHDREQRRALSIIVVLDRSASMRGDPLANAKRAATSLIAQLDDGDSFAVVTFSDRDELVIAAGKASPERKHAASEAIDRIVAGGGTCASCGIIRGEHEILQSPDLRGIHRMVFISDGQANLGIRSQDELVELAGRTAEHGVSISTVGVGLDFDEETLIRIGETAHGNYYFAKDTAQLGTVFATELTGLRRIIATHVSLLALQEDGNPIERAYGYPLQTIKRGVVVPIADLGDEEARKVVLHGLVTAREVGSYQLTWIDPADGNVHSARTTLATTITKDPARVAATRDAEATAAVEQARVARAIDQSVTVYEHVGAAAAEAMIQHSLRDGHITDQAALRGAEAAMTSYEAAGPEAAGPEAKKSVRALAYDLARAPTD